jgi:hypothetical protein
MASGSGSSAIGVGAIGFGVLLLWSAYTKKPLFGTVGLIRSFINSGSLERAGKQAAKTAQDVANAAKKAQPASAVTGSKTVTV